MRARTRISPVSLALAGALVIALLGALVAQLAPPAAAAPTELLFAEYVEGSGNNKAIEIANGTGAAVTLTGTYDVQIFANGSPTATATIPLTGTMAAGDVFVLARSTAVAAILAEADQTSTNFLWNGNDAVALRKAGAFVDVIGQIGVDPGTEWGSGDTTTFDHTLRRKPQVQAGDVDGSNPFDPTVEWETFPLDTFSGLGSHTFAPGGGGGGGSQAPTCSAVALSTLEDEPAEASPACADTDGDTLTYEIVDQAVSGIAAVLGGQLHYEPGADENGSDSFTYRASDGANTSEPATAAVSIAPVNDDPDGDDDTATTEEDEPVVIDVLANDTDIDGDALVVTEVEDPVLGTVTVAPDGSSVIYGPQPNANGSDAFEYTVADGADGIEFAEVTVTIIPVDDAPHAVDDVASVASGASVVVDAVANDSAGPPDESGQALAVTSVGTPSHGSATLVAEGAELGRIRYTPSAGYRGSDSFSYAVSDGSATATGTVHITVTAPPLTTICGLPATVLGTKANDVIVGTPGDDVIRARRGNDQIDGGGGNDVICGGPGADRITAGAGDDVIAAGTGLDTIDAGDGRNRLRGGPGNDAITAGSGSDAVTAGAGSDTVVAGDGTNRVAAGPGDDGVVSGAGDDRIDGGAGTDSCDADGGRNVLLRCE